MKVTMEIRQFRKKPIRLVLSEGESVDPIDLAQLRKLWETEQALNNLPGTKVRFHINVEPD